MVLGKFAVNKFAVGKLASTVHCPVHLHTGPAPSVYTAFRPLGEISYGKLVYGEVVYGEFSGHGRKYM